MKRNKNLEYLSWEHHDGLVAIFRLREGLRNGTETTIILEYLLHVWENALTHHFRMEEEVFGSHLKLEQDEERLLIRMMEEHAVFRNLVQQIEDNPSSSNIKEFADLLKRHIRFEERELFPFMEKELSDEKLAEIGKFLDAHYKPGDQNWEPRFWQDL